MVSVSVSVSENPACAGFFNGICSGGFCVVPRLKNCVKSDSLNRL